MSGQLDTLDTWPLQKNLCTHWIVVDLVAIINFCKFYLEYFVFTLKKISFVTIFISVENEHRNKRGMQNILMLCWSKLFHSLYQFVWWLNYCSHSKHILSRSVGAHFFTPYITLFNDSDSITLVINRDIKEYLKERMGIWKTDSAE